MTTPDTEPLFTVIIPTKDRADYLYHTLRTCALQEYENFEVIVADDGSTDHTRDMVLEASRKDSRIRYMTPGRGVGMLEIFEYALDQVRPGYVLALGGDDALLPHGISDMWRVLKETGQEMLGWPPPVYFYAGTRSDDAQVIMHHRRGRLQSGTRVLSSTEFLQRQARELSYVSDIESPMFYVKGVTSTRLVNAVRSRTPDGRFYSCATPDGYSGIVLAGEVPTFAFSGTPFSMHGVSPTSAGLGYMNATEEAKKISEQFFRYASQRPMHKDLGSQPYSPLITLMTADYLLTTRDLPGWPGVTPVIDYRALLLQAITELRDALMPSNRLVRELAILNGVAEYHGLGEFFRKAVERSRRNRKSPLGGNAMSPSRMYIDANAAGVTNVYEAAFFTYFAHRLSPMATFGAVWSALTNSVRYRLQAAQDGEAFPPYEQWKSGPSRP